MWLAHIVSDDDTDCDAFVKHMSKKLDQFEFCVT